MENILARALTEALTPLYSEELRDSYDTGYKFSPEFENRMRELIRRTERPLWLRPGVIAAAACAVIGISSAILVPALMNNRIDTQPPADTSVSSVSAVTAEPPETDITVTTPDITVTAPDITVTTPTEKSVTTPDTSDTTADISSGTDTVSDPAPDSAASSDETAPASTPEQSAVLM